MAVCNHPCRSSGVGSCLVLWSVQRDFCWACADVLASIFGQHHDSVRGPGIAVPCTLRLAQVRRSRTSAYSGAVAAWLAMMSFSTYLILHALTTPAKIGPTGATLAVALTPFFYIPFLFVPYAVGAIVGAFLEQGECSLGPSLPFAPKGAATERNGLGSPSSHRRKRLG